MLQAERHMLIKKRLTMQYAVTIRDLCKELKVTRQTVRKDLTILSNQNALIQVHGGAICNSAG